MIPLANKSTHSSHFFVYLNQDRLITKNVYLLSPLCSLHLTHQIKLHKMLSNEGVIFLKMEVVLYISVFTTPKKIITQFVTLYQHSTNSSTIQKNPHNTISSIACASTKMEFYPLCIIHAIHSDNHIDDYMIGK